MPSLRKDEVHEKRLAINMFDLSRVDESIRGVILRDKLDLRRESVILLDKNRLDETAIPFTCDLLSAACICDVIREHDRRAGDYPARVYYRRATVWEKLPATAILSLVRPGKVILNPGVFRVDIEAGSPLPQTRLEF